MKIAISTVGSTGDIQPYLALSIRLKAAGHDVKAVSHPFHQARFEQYGIPFAACGPVVSQSELNDMLSKMLQTKNPVKQLKMLMEEAFFAEGESYYQSAKEAFSDREIVLNHMVDFLGAEAAAQLGLPRVGGILAPTGIPSKFTIVPALPNLGPLINPLLWRLVAFGIAPIDRSGMRFLAKCVKGEPKTQIKSFHVLSDRLNLIGASQVLCPTYPDLPAKFKVTGPWILEEPAFDPPKELAEFLKRHPQPVVVSLGSMGGNLGPELTSKILAAIEQLGIPAVIQSGYAGLFAEKKPENVFFAGFVSHEWLFPQASMVIHHGGAGTTTAVARAGVPQVILTFIADQPYFAAQVKRLGLGPQSIWYHRMNAANLASRMQAVLDNPEFSKRAKDFRQQILAEKGTERALDLLESHFKTLKA